MMNVSEYASDVGKTVEDILSLCKRLSISASGEEDMLSDDDIIMLDNEIASLDETEVEAEEDLPEFEEELEVLEVPESRPAKKNKPSKVNSNREDFKEKRKEMYKHKEKLKSNLSEEGENVILYKDNMTVSDLANSLGVNPVAIIKKLMTLGMMVTIYAGDSYTEHGVSSSHRRRTRTAGQTVRSLRWRPRPAPCCHPGTPSAHQCGSCSVPSSVRGRPHSPYCWRWRSRRNRPRRR